MFFLAYQGHKSLFPDSPIREAQTILIDDICDLNPVVTVYQPIIKSGKLHDDGVNDAEYSAGTLHKAWIEK